MNFLPDVYVPCEVCKGKRYNRETLEIRFKGKTIADVLDMTVEEAVRVLRADPHASPTSSTHSTTWAWATSAWGSPRRRSPAARRSASSWPPSSRAARPARRCTSWTSRRPGCTSPMSSDCCSVLQRLVDSGNTVMVIEHNLDIIKAADWLIDLGPEGGERRRRDHRRGDARADRASPQLIHRAIPRQSAPRRPVRV